MSRRAGGPGGRRPDSAQPSFHRGGGRGGGRGRGRGGVGASPSTPPVSAAPPRQQSSGGAGAGPSTPPVSAAPSRQQPSPSVVEKMSDLSLTTPPPPSSSKSINPPTRPGYGTVGTKCVVRANHFLVKVAEIDLYHYDVTISPEITSKRLNREVMKQLVDRFKESHMGNRLPAYDGKKSLYTAGALPFESKVFSFNLIDDRKGGQSSFTIKKDRTFNVTIKFAGKPDINHLIQFLSARQRDCPLETIQALDVVLRARPSEIYTVVGRSFFSGQLGEKGELGDGLEYWRGYYQSIRPTQMGLSFNIDVSARGFYEPILVTDFVTKYFGLRDLSRPLSDQNRVKVKKALKGINVEFTYRGSTMSYKITGVSDQPLNRLTFTLDDKATETTVVQYFREKYDISLRYTSLPALQAKSSARPIFIPMEVCKISAGQRYTKKLNEKQVTALLRATCQRPRDREYEIKKMVQRNDFKHNKLVNDEFGISVAEELSVVNARVLPPPMLKYHDTGREATVDPRFGQWNMINKKMIDGGSVDFWTCVSFSQRVQPDLPSEFCRQLVEMCRSKGMQFNQNPILPIHSAYPNQIENTLKDIHNRCNQLGKKLKLLIIILPDFSGSYGNIKRVCETELGIVSQCCQPRQALKLSKQYMENVALKINVKVGGRNTILNDAILRRINFVTDVPTIIFGADVTHPQAGDDSCPSIAAVVASMDWPHVTKYRGLVSAQRHREEIIEDLYKSTQDPQKGTVHGGMIRELFIAFRNATRGLKPERIIFYRDGVSEGQFSQVLLDEIEAIRKACSSLQEGYQPRITFIVVQKRHHTRLFPADYNKRDQMDKSGNILPGTVVDTQICHPMEFDFFLNSHAGIQGTSRPAHYHVLFDENKFDANSLQTLTNNLCYTYARCTRSVSVVPPAYYAHLAAFRARYYIEGEYSDAGSSSGGSSREKIAEVRSLPVIKENVKDVMFYC